MCLHRDLDSPDGGADHRAGAEAAPLVLAENGSARAVILTPARPSLVEKYAAGQMATYLSRMTGGSFQVVEEVDDHPGFAAGVSD